MASPLPAPAIAAFRELLGDRAVDSAEPLEAAARSTFRTEARPSAILRVRDADEVRACVRLAREHHLALHPISRGRNWGYGSRVPSSDGAAILDLSALDRIVGYDARLGLLTIEPGVTFAQAAAFLAERGGRHHLASIGGPPDASVLANAIERGDGVGPHGDAFAHVAGLEVVLGTGESIATGHARFPNSRTAGAFRWGVGPLLDGLFSQSNFGVVTRLTLWLARTPAQLDEFLASVDTAEALGPLVEATRELIEEGTLRGAVSIWNDLKALSKLTQYPFAEVGNRTPLPETWRAAFRERFFGGRWNLSGALGSATPELQAALRARLEARLAPVVAKLRFRDSAEAQRGRQAGAVTTENLRMAYWRKRTPMPADPDPDRDRCGLLWVSCAVPLTGADALEAVDIAERVTRMFAYDANVSILATSPRAALLVALIVYDREVRDEDERARACHDAMLRELCEAGFFPSRLGLQAMTPPIAPSDDSGEVLRRLKAALDPDSVLAPGRYGI
jgi:4-cresol dehydrogenase (hydroxylating)